MNSKRGVSAPAFDSQGIITRFAMSDKSHKTMLYKIVTTHIPNQSFSEHDEIYFDAANNAQSPVWELQNEAHDEHPDRVEVETQLLDTTNPDDARSLDYYGLD